MQRSSTQRTRMGMTCLLGPLWLMCVHVARCCSTIRARLTRPAGVLATFSGVSVVTACTTCVYCERTSPLFMLRPACSR